MEIRILPQRRRARYRPDRRAVMKLQPPLYTVERTFFHIEKKKYEPKESFRAPDEFFQRRSFRLEGNRGLLTGVDWLYLSTASEHLVRITATD